MKSICFFLWVCLLAFCIGPAPVQAVNTDSVDMELASVESAIALINEQILYEKTRALRSKEKEQGLDQNLQDLQAQIGFHQKLLPELEELEQYSRKKAAEIRAAAAQLEKYVETLQRIQKQNLIKTLLSLAIQTAQEINAFVTTSGKVHEIGKWAAEKAAKAGDKVLGEAMKEILPGGDEYYTRAVSGMISQVAKATPEMERLANLSKMSVEGWQSYLHKHEDKDISGSTATILAKLRILLEHAQSAAKSLAILERYLENTAKQAGMEIWSRRKIIEELEDTISGIHNQAEDRQSGKSLHEQKIEALEEELAELEQLRIALLEKKAGIEEDREPEPDVSSHEEAVARYKKTREEYLAAIPGFRQRAAQIQQLLQEASKIRGTGEKLERIYKKQLEDLTKQNKDKPMYPDPTYYDESRGSNATVRISDREALQNFKDRSRQWLDAMRDHENRLEQRLSAYSTATADMEGALTAEPDDPYTAEQMRSGLNKDHAAAQTLLSTAVKHKKEKIARLEEKRAQSNDSAEKTAYHRMIRATEGEIEQLAAQKEGLKRIHRELPPDPYATTGPKAKSFLVYHHKKGRWPDTAQDMQKKLENFRNQIEAYQNSVQQRKLDYEQEIAEKSREYEMAAEAFLNNAGEVINAFDAHSAASDRLLNFLRARAGAGILIEKKSGTSPRFSVNWEWVSELVRDHPGNCAAIELVLDKVRPLADRGDKLLAEARFAREMAKTGASPPLSRWAEINRPGLYANVEARAEELKAASERNRQAYEVYLRNPLSDIVDGFFTNATLMTRFPEIFAGIQKTYKDLSMQIQHGIDDALRLEGREALVAGQLTGLQDLVKTARKRYVRELSCLGAEFSLNSRVEALLDELEAAVAKLDGKEVYADAGLFIAGLEDLLEQINSLPMGHSQQYYDMVRQVSARAGQAEERFEDQRGSLAPADIETIRALLYDISEHLRAHQAELPPEKGPEITSAQVKALYQSFINAYARGDVRALLSLLAPDWQGGDGSDIYDVEQYLTNSFRVFERIQYRISGFSARPSADGGMQVVYNVKITGQNSRQRLQHEETAKIVEQVALIDGKPRIIRTISGSQWLR